MARFKHRYVDCMTAIKIWLVSNLYIHFLLRINQLHMWWSRVLGRHLIWNDDPHLSENYLEIHITYMLYISGIEFALKYFVYLVSIPMFLKCYFYLFAWVQSLQKTLSMFQSQIKKCSNFSKNFFLQNKRILEQFN